MRFNGKDVLAVHYALPSIHKEFPPAHPARNITTIETSAGDMVASVDLTQDEYTLRLNLAAATYDEAMQAREALAAWATTSQPAELQPTHMPGRAYKAILKQIRWPETRYGTVDVVFMLPRPVQYSMIEKTASGISPLEVTTGGTASVQPDIVFTAFAASSGVTISVDGKPFYTIKTSLQENNEVTIHPETGEVLVNGFDKGADIDYTQSNPDIELTPGKHTLTASRAGRITVRWHDQWL